MECNGLPAGSNVQILPAAAITTSGAYDKSRGRLAMVVQLDRAFRSAGPIFKYFGLDTSSTKSVQ